ncbi:hypothetical protein ACJIZ3_004551 [Penstemon smallii]|uniref:NHL domain-containing protein n=1 Tax=Penstemon smallii TaxID=265156 RepID=A0ABD3S2D4_9LAMI
MDESTATVSHNRRRCCFSFTCFDGNSETNDSLWSRGVGALKKIREWSEIVAGPRWKTFIRRFSRNRSGINHTKQVNNFQYDPLSYAMNFDEGPGQNGHLNEEEDGYYYASRNFSSRYAKGSMDLGKDGPTFV